MAPSSPSFQPLPSDPSAQQLMDVLLTSHTLAGGCHFGTNICCVRWVKFLLVPLRKKKCQCQGKDGIQLFHAQSKGVVVLSGGGGQALLLWHHLLVAWPWANTTIPWLSFPPYISRVIKLARFEFVL